MDRRRLLYLSLFFVWTTGPAPLSGQDLPTNETATAGEGNIIFSLTLYPTEDGSFGGTLFPITQFKDGVYSNPLDTPVSPEEEAKLSYGAFAAEIWSASLDQLGDLTVWSGGEAVGTVRVSEATTSWMPGGLFV